VIWAVTIATFVGTIVASILIFLLYYERHRIRDALRNRGYQRMEARAWASVQVELSSLDKPPTREMTLTRNVSHHGVCALTKNRWLPNSKALVRFLPVDVSVHARIAYCNGSSDLFVVGLQFSTAIDPWMPPTVRVT
jgi:hypothetical protein